MVSNMSFFYLKNWRNDPIWRAYVSNGWVQPPTSNDLPCRGRSHHQNLRNKGKLGDVIFPRRVPQTEKTKAIPYVTYVNGWISLMVSTCR